MRYELPQFINIEDKIFGPFTFVQFVYLAGGAGISYVLWQLLPTIIAVIIILPIVGLSLALAFYKVNGRPFIFVMQAAVSHALKSKFYLWKKKKNTSGVAQEQKDVLAPVETIPSRTSNLREISFNLDMLDMDDPNANRGRK
jgi:hypothetical protein